MRAGTPNSLWQTSASAAMPLRISSWVGLAKQSRIRLRPCGLLTDHSGPGLMATPAFQRRLVELHRIDVVGQLDPEEDAALRLLEFGGGAELLVERFHQSIELSAQPLGQNRDMLSEVRSAVFR